MRRVVTLFLTLVLLWAIMAQINDFAARANIGLFAGGLFVAYSALVLPLPGGLAATLLAGLVCDANAPVPFGTHAFLFGLAHLLIFRLRDRLPRDEDSGQMLVALGANLALFLAVSAAVGRRGPQTPAVWATLAVDLACSQIFVALAAPWFFALQARALALFRAGPEWR